MEIGKHVTFDFLLVKNTVGDLVWDSSITIFLLVNFKIYETVLNVTSIRTNG